MDATAFDPKYPIGHYDRQPFSDSQLKDWVNDIKFLPSQLESSITNLDAHQLDTPYREGGWKIGQLVHHVADSHMNAYMRFRLGLTEDNPTIKPYEEKEWAKLRDSAVLPPNISLTLLHALHTRWHETLLGITREQWERTVVHPQNNRQMTLWYLLGMYAWHGRHHTAHINHARKIYGWE